MMRQHPLVFESERILGRISAEDKVCPLVFPILFQTSKSETAIPGQGQILKLTCYVSKTFLLLSHIHI